MKAKNRAKKIGYKMSLLPSRMAHYEISYGQNTDWEFGQNPQQYFGHNFFPKLILIFVLCFYFPEKWIFCKIIRPIIASLKGSMAKIEKIRPN